MVEHRAGLERQIQGHVGGDADDERVAVEHLVNEGSGGDRALRVAPGLAVDPESTVCRRRSQKDGSDVSSAMGG